MEVLEELLAAVVGAGTDARTKGAGAWVAAEVGFREEEEVDLGAGGGVGSGF